MDFYVVGILDAITSKRAGATGQKHRSDKMNKIIGTILVVSCSWMMGCAAEEPVGSSEDESALSTTSIDSVDISVEKSLTKALNAPARSLNDHGVRENSKLFVQVGRPQ